MTEPLRVFVRGVALPKGTLPDFGLGSFVMRTMAPMRLVPEA